MFFLPSSNALRKAAVAAVAVALLSSVSLYAAGGSREFVQIRVETGQEGVTIEMPFKLLEYLDKHSKGSCELGKVEGADVKLRLGDLLKAAKDNKAREKEVLAFEAADESGKKVRFYLKTSEKKVAGKSAKPTKISFSAKDKGGKESVRLSFSIDTISSLASNLDSGDSGSSDFGPFLKTCLSAAAELGEGILVRIVAKDGEVGLYLE